MAPVRERPRRAALVGAATGSLVFVGVLLLFLVMRSEAVPAALGKSLAWAGHLPPVKVAPAPTDPAPTLEHAPSLVPPVETQSKRLSTHPGTKPAAKQPASCDPPYVRGPDGITRFKRECLK